MTETDFQMRMGLFLESEMAELQRSLAARLVPHITDLGWTLEARGPALHLSPGYGSMDHAYSMWDGDRQEGFQLTLSHVATWSGSPRPFAELTLPMTWTCMLTTGIAELDNQNVPIHLIASAGIADVTVTLESFNNIETVITSVAAHLRQEMEAPMLLEPFTAKLLEALAP